MVMAHPKVEVFPDGHPHPATDGFKPTFSIIGGLTEKARSARAFAQD
jgi:hypothetical protein